MSSAEDANSCGVKHGEQTRDPAATTTTTEKKSRSPKQERRQKRKLSAETTYEDLLEGWTQCCFLVPRKNKLCNIDRAPASKYCGVHMPSEERAAKLATAAANSKCAEGDSVHVVENPHHMKFKDAAAATTRIPCPLDPSHSVYSHQLEKHLKICNYRKIEDSMSSELFYRKDCNSGPYCSNCSHEAASGGDADNVSSVDVFKLVEKINTTFESIVSAELMPSASLGPTPQLASNIQQALGADQSSFKRTRHIEQDTLLVRQMIAKGLISYTEEQEENNAIVAVSADKDAKSTTDSASSAAAAAAPAVYVELGAGKGLLGLAVSCAAPQESPMVFVERSGSRRKADRTIKSSQTDRLFHRVRMDIRHCFLPGLPGILQNDSTIASTASQSATADNAQAFPRNLPPVVLVAKHLCGVATDLALRSLQPLFATSDTSNTSTTTSSSGSSSGDIGVAIATCCHHCCNWNDYVGTEWLTSIGFTREEFSLLRPMTGWQSMLRPDRTEIQAQVASNIGIATSNNTSVSTMAATTTTTTTSTAGVVKAAPSKDKTFAGERGKLGGGGEGGGEVVEEDTGEYEQEREHQAPAEKHASVFFAPLTATLSRDDMAQLGVRVKRMLDYGRVRYLRDVLHMKAEIVNYCDPALSLECMAIIAHSGK